MVLLRASRSADYPPLSVLALSSRFDGRWCLLHGSSCPRLSVLALSSRFDGHRYKFTGPCLASTFQYSLCRVVLMVCAARGRCCRGRRLSVLALSSRFDGLSSQKDSGYCTQPLSVLALSSRFDGQR